MLIGLNEQFIIQDVNNFYDIKYKNLCVKGEKYFNSHGKVWMFKFF